MAIPLRNESLIEQLDAYLSSDDSPQDCMTLSTMDGFLFGIACSPTYIKPREWAPVAVGENIGSVPCWVFEVVSVLYEETSLGLAEDPQVVEPIFRQSDGDWIAEDWCEGFMTAVSLRPQAWLRLTESGSHGPLLTPIMANLFDEQGKSILGIPEVELDRKLTAAADMIPESVVGIYQFWREIN